MAPQKEAPIQRPPTTAATPIVVELSRILSIAFWRLPCSKFGKRRWMSMITLSSISGLSTSWPNTNSTSSAKGNTASIRL
jgi:hypothetical protein